MPVTRMTPCSYVTSAVLARLQSVNIPGIKAEEVVVLPEGQVPPSMGERQVVISPESIQTIIGGDFKGKLIHFKIHFIQRMRVTPNDRQGLLYLVNNEVHDAQETMEEAIQSLAMFSQLQTLMIDNEAANPTQKKFSISRSFAHKMTTLNPIHLYPGFFNARPSAEDSKIAGYRFYQTFHSPIFWPTSNPLACNGL